MYFFVIEFIIMHHSFIFLCSCSLHGMCKALCALEIVIFRTSPVLFPYSRIATSQFNLFLNSLLLDFFIVLFLFAFSLFKLSPCVFTRLGRLLLSTLIHSPYPATCFGYLSFDFWQFMSDLSWWLASFSPSTLTSSIGISSPIERHLKAWV